MKTNCLLIAVFCFGTAFAQENEKKYFKNSFSLSSDYFSTLLRENDNLSPMRDQLNKKTYFLLAYERRFHQDASYGIQFLGSKHNVNITDGSGNSNTLDANNLGIGISVNYDWSRMLGLNSSKFDIITGLGTSFSIHNNLEGYHSNSNDYDASFDLGYRLRINYWFTERIGVGAEMNGSFLYGNNSNVAKGFSVPKFIGLNYRF